jgi:hypothetical protein
LNAFSDEEQSISELAASFVAMFRSTARSPALEQSSVCVHYITTALYVVTKRTELAA